MDQQIPRQTGTPPTTVEQTPGQAARMSPDTLAVHAGRGGLRQLGAGVPPIDRGAFNPLPDVDVGGASYDSLAAGLALADGQVPVYRRLWGPNAARLEEAVAALDGTKDAVAFSTGMAAVNTLFKIVADTSKRHIVAVRPLYGGTDHTLARSPHGIEVTWSAPTMVHSALRRDSGLIFVETPANPSMDLIDLDELVRQADGVPVAVDNTFATPVLQAPARHGVTLVIASATKFIGGHGDALGGVISTTPEWAAKLRAERALAGNILSPDEAYMLHRGLQTMPVRVRAQQESARRIAEWLTEQAAVSRVLYPGLPGCDPQGLVGEGRQMAGPGSMLAFGMHGGYEAATRVAHSVRLITHAVSLGGVQSLIQHPAALTHRPVEDSAKPDGDLLRVSVGLEDAQDLISDLEQAVAA
ncbi:PLP-dependent aspartate aminotransferase family protein [Streptomyces sp. NPDC013433]|uniref:trans-sulfuration enzyme family protein n=1 Tax=Streptomyces sp. NPDC013433 TaxID=3155604 RepID=UPI0034567107